MNTNYGIYDWGTYKVVAPRFGLVVDDNTHIHGVINQIPVSIGRISGGDPEVVYTAILPRGAPVSFSLAEKDLIEKTGDFFRGLTSSASGYDEFDRRFAIHAANAPALAGLFNAEARALLCRLTDERLHPLVTPQMISLHAFSMGGTYDTEPRIEQAIRELVLAAHVLSRSFFQAATPATR